MGERVDLDDLERVLHPMQQRSMMLRAQDVADLLALVTELRAAREVVREARLAADPTPWLRDALAAYDRHVQPGDAPGSG